MPYVLTFTLKTAGYRCHAAHCSAARETRQQHVVPVVFDSPETARQWADEDEREKGGARADFKMCKCARQ